MTLTFYQIRRTADGKYYRSSMCWETNAQDAKLFQRIGPARTVVSKLEPKMYLYSELEIITYQAEPVVVSNEMSRILKQKVVREKRDKERQIKQLENQQYASESHLEKLLTDIVKIKNQLKNL